MYKSARYILKVILISMQMYFKFSPQNFINITPQWNVLGHTATTKCEGSPKFQELTPSPFSGWCWWLGTNKTDNCLLVLVLPSHQQQPETRDGESPWNVRESSHLVEAVCPRTFHSSSRRDIFKTNIILPVSQSPICDKSPDNLIFIGLVILIIFFEGWDKNKPMYMDKPRIPSYCWTF